jgi:hypothetical protein
MAKEMLTPRAAAERIGVSDQTIYNWIAGDVFRGVITRGIGKIPRYLIPLSEVDRIKTLGNYGTIAENSNAHYAHA